MESRPARVRDGARLRKAEALRRRKLRGGRAVARPRARRKRCRKRSRASFEQRKRFPTCEGFSVRGDENVRWCAHTALCRCHRTRPIGGGRWRQEKGPGRNG